MITKACKKLPISYLLMDSWFTCQEMLACAKDAQVHLIGMMKHYQVRWTIEVYFKESKQYLNLGRCQSEDLDAQAADAAIAMIQYILLSLNKRFGDYETKGELFRYAEQTMQELTLQSRIWGLYWNSYMQLLNYWNWI